jgi:peptidoglycan biosynthesis protein MviN/MurJ (putative lipid II flippase)
VSALILLIIVATTIWLGVDASQRDWSASSFAKRPGLWIFGSLALWIVVFPVYLVARGHAPLKQHA